MRALLVGSLIAAALFVPARADAAAPSDLITVKASGYQVSGAAVSGGITVTDDITSFGTSSIAGSATLSGGAVVTAGVKLDGLILSGPIAVTDTAAKVKISGGGLAGFSRLADDTVRWSGLATVTRSGRAALDLVTVTIVDRAVDPGDHAVNLRHAGQDRQAIVHVPASAAPSNRPVLYHFPGLGEFPAIAESTGSLRAAADRHGYLLVIPAHYGPGWQGVLAGTPFPDVDDPGYVRALNTAVLARFGGDPRRVYASGMSNGGFFTSLLACELPDVFAAFAPVSGQLNDPASCTPSRKVPIVMFSGDGDPIVPYSWTAPALSFWLRHNGCGTAVVDTKLPDLDPEDGTTVIRHTYPGCPATAPVVLFQIVGGGHTWPGGSPYPVDTGKLTKDISANEEIWQFVSRFSL